MSNSAKILTASAVACSILLSSCASIFNRSNQPVEIVSNPTGLTFKVTNRAGEEVTRGVTPSKVDLNTSASYMKGEAYLIVFSKNGKEVGRKQLSAKVSGWYFGNILLGGLIGMLVVDPLTGSMYTLPNQVALDSPTSAGLDQSAARSLSIVPIDHLTPEQRASLVRL